MWFFLEYLNHTERTEWKEYMLCYVWFTCLKDTPLDYSYIPFHGLMPTRICVSMWLYCIIWCVHDVTSLFVSSNGFICVKYASLSEYEYEYEHDYEEKSHELTSIYSVRSHIYDICVPHSTRHQNCHLISPLRMICAVDVWYIHEWLECVHAYNNLCGHVCVL